MRDFIEVVVMGVVVATLFFGLLLWMAVHGFVPPL